MAYELRVVRVPSGVIFGLFEVMEPWPMNYV
jgi:hypothetical protein